MKGKEIRLTEEEQYYLKDYVQNGVHAAKAIRRARVLLLLDRTGKTDHVRYKRTAEQVGCSVQAIYNMRDEFLDNPDLDMYLMRKKRETPPVAPKVDGKVEAQAFRLSQKLEMRWMYLRNTGTKNTLRFRSLGGITGLI